MKLGAFIGLTCLDMVYYLNDIPLENKKAKTNNYNMYIGGPAANAAITYALLGGKSVLISQIGDSELGKTIKRELREDYQIEIIDCAADSDILPSIASIAVNVTNASRTIWSGQQSSQNINCKIVNDITTTADFYLSDCNLPELSLGILQAVKKDSKPIVLDAGSWKDNFKLFLSVADDVIASADCKPQTHNNDFIAAAYEYGVKNIAITNGDDLIKWKSQDEEGTVKPPLVRAIDTLAAGDVFHGAYCYFRFEKSMSFNESLRMASEVAALSVEYLGPRQGVKEYYKKNICR